MEKGHRAKTETNLRVSFVLGILSGILDDRGFRHILAGELSQNIVPQ